MTFYVFVVFFFFFKQKTAYEMRISDWSSDVCSSDLLYPGGQHQCEAIVLYIEIASTAAREISDEAQRKSDAEQGRVRPLPVRAIAGIKYFGFIHALQRRRPVDSENDRRSEEHTSELQSLMRISYAVFCLKKKRKTQTKN